MTTPTDSTINLAAKVRLPLNERLSQLVLRLRTEGIRTSKAELVEMMLWELPPAPDDAFRKRLRRFRQEAPSEVSV